MDENNEQMPVEKKNNKSALTSLILSLVGIIIAGIPCGIGAVATGVTGLRNFNPETEKNKWMAIFGIVLGIIDVVLVAMALPNLYEQLGIL